ncbi:hypothetical protein F511_16652 [Dorcoceras hygrometricum]|uniref:Uncharacterized protein n=1 Tax=Dorcoceras hygrometricum TaxID=472368 RepID=A0A2Z7AWS1_9LAMI|nr:hypothetical protein F511_16652 [Dorcoceras hygrometricum]
MRRRFVVATGSPAASEFGRYCLLLVFRESLRLDDVSGATSFELVATLRFEVATGSSRERSVALFSLATGYPAAGLVFGAAGRVRLPAVSLISNPLDLRCVCRVFNRLLPESSGFLAGLVVAQYKFLVDWAVKMRISPLELETSISDVKYHVSLVPHFDPFTDFVGVIWWRDWVRSDACRSRCFVVEDSSLAFMRAYPMLSEEALSVIPRVSWGDVSRRFTMIRWGYNITNSNTLDLALAAPLSTSTSRPPLAALRRRPPPSVFFVVGLVPITSTRSSCQFVSSSSAD